MPPPVATTTSDNQVSSCLTFHATTIARTVAILQRGPIQCHLDCHHAPAVGHLHRCIPHPRLDNSVPTRSCPSQRVLRRVPPAPPYPLMLLSTEPCSIHWPPDGAWPRHVLMIIPTKQEPSWLHHLCKAYQVSTVVPLTGHFSLPAVSSACALFSPSTSSSVTHSDRRLTSYAGSGGAPHRGAAHCASYATSP
jgi:hypothetical protein